MPVEFLILSQGEKMNSLTIHELFSSFVYIFFLNKNAINFGRIIICSVRKYTVFWIYIKYGKKKTYLISSFSTD